MLYREAVATIAISPNRLSSLEKLLAEYQTTWKKQLKGIDDNLQLSIQSTGVEVTEVINQQQQNEMVASFSNKSLWGCKYGVRFYQM